jgi:hypothetical protein
MQAQNIQNNGIDFRPIDILLKDLRVSLLNIEVTEADLLLDIIWRQGAIFHQHIPTHRHLWLVVTSDQ